jgi:hypothetical protein
MIYNNYKLKSLKKMTIFHDERISSFFMIFIKRLMKEIVIGHTQPKAPDPIRTPKLSGWRRG